MDVGLMMVMEKRVKEHNFVHQLNNDLDRCNQKVFFVSFHFNRNSMCLSQSIFDKYEGLLMKFETLIKFTKKEHRTFGNVIR